MKMKIPTLKNSALMFSAIAAAIPAHASSDYGPALWVPDCAGHYYTSGYGHWFHIVHCMDGFYGSTISAMQNCNLSTSIHYLSNSGSGTSGYVPEYGRTFTDSDGKPAGEITQMISEANWAAQAFCWNL